MNANTRSLVVGGATLAAARFHFKQPWPVAVIAALGAMVLLDFLTPEA